MAEQVLTDQEKEALLDGVATGEVEVQSFSGPRYAKVRAFEIPERSRMATNSFPRLQRLNRRFADRAARLAEQLVSNEVAITPGAITTCPYGEYCDRNPEFSIVLEYTLKPLPDAFLVYVPAALVRLLVEAFYGGGDNEPPEHAPDMFTPGETNVAALFSGDLVATLVDVWRPLVELEHARAGTHLSTDIIDGFETSDTVIAADFEIEFAGQRHAFHIVWLRSMVASLLPVFEGQKRERDPEQDAFWQRSIRASVTDSVVTVASIVGRGRLPLRAAAGLKPGDVIDIEDPVKSTLCVKNVPVIEGRFGIHEGRHAMEAGQWLAAARAADLPRTD
ncbi:MAG: FliM/FliN family flagellar motor switch protein [Woeseiaceae bacterium]|nr:FliM/FliN family flagellar motor switch protein [Woeseiaceae bacterium]